MSAEVSASRCTVSVVIPVRDDAAGLDRCLGALSAQDYPDGLVEVLVVDNASQQDIAAVVHRHDGVRLLVEPTGGSYAARNTGLSRATGDVIAFTDADCTPEPSWLAAAVEALEQEPRAAMVGGAVHLTYRAGAPVTGSELFEAVHGFQQQYYLEEHHYAVTANMVTWRSTFDEIGLFDGALMSRGDAEWGQRVAAGGLLQRYAPSAVVRHPARATLRESVRKWHRVATGKLAVDRGRGMPRVDIARSVRWQGHSWALTLYGLGRDTRLPSARAKVRYMCAYTIYRAVTASVLLSGFLPERGEELLRAASSTPPSA